MMQVRVGISYCKVQNDTVKSLVQPKSPLPWVYAAYRLLMGLFTQTMRTILIDSCAPNLHHVLQTPVRFFIISHFYFVLR